MHLSRPADHARRNLRRARLAVVLVGLAWPYLVALATSRAQLAQFTDVGVGGTLLFSRSTR